MTTSKVMSLGSEQPTERRQLCLALAAEAEATALGAQSEVERRDFTAKALAWRALAEEIIPAESEIREQSEVWRAANILIDRYRGEAPFIAMERYLAMSILAEREGAKRWLEILFVLTDFLARQVVSDAALH
jgi:hypothetical protein